MHHRPARYCASSGSGHEKLLKDSGSSLIFSDTKHLPIARDAIKGNQKSESCSPTLPTILRRSYAILIRSSPPDREASPPVPVTTDDLASLIYTSGTTADPKGVMLTHANLLGEVEAVFAWAHLGPDDALLGVLPLFHVLSQMANLLLPLVAGARTLSISTLNTTELLRALGERQITAFAVVPQFFNLIHDKIFNEVSQKGAATRIAFGLMRRVTVLLRRARLNPGPIFFGKDSRALRQKDALPGDRRLALRSANRARLLFARNRRSAGLWTDRNNWRRVC